MNDFNYDNEIIEIDSDNTPKAENVVTSNSNSEFVPPIKKPKRSLKDKWNDIPKKKRTIIIITLSLILLLIIATILYFTVFKKEKKEVVEEEKVVLEKDNYRYENGKLLFLDKSDKVIGEYECVNKEPEKCMVMKNDYTKDEFERVISTYENGEEITKFGQIYDNNYVFVTDGKESFLYNIKDSKKELNVTNIKTYGTEKNLVVIADEDEKYGLIEVSNEGFDYLIRPSYNYLGIVNTKLVYLVANDKDKTYIIDSDGKKISSNISGLINSVNDKYITVLKNESYNLYSYANEELLSDYDYIGLYDNVIGLVDSNRLYLRDNDLNKLNEDGLRLKNSYYVKNYVYDKDNKLKETNKAFEIVVKDNIAMVTIDDEVKNINMFEGQVSSKYAYMSYFDGKLYFYNDEEKEDLLGIYTCNNKNEISNKDSKLDKCTILTNINGYTGIYNNNIVILYDNYGNEEVKYTIYSLKEKKVKGTYSYLEIVNEEEINENIEHIGTNASYLISQTDTGNNKGNYGILEINSSKISGKVGFNYKEIKKEKDYYLFKDTNDLYSIYNVSFTKISNDFNYLKLYENYYVGIKDNKLNVYTYLGTKVLEQELEVTDNKYEIDFTDGIKITIGDKVYNYNNSGKLIVNEQENSNSEDNGANNNEG